MLRDKKLQYLIRKLAIGCAVAFLVTGCTTYPPAPASGANAARTQAPAATPEIVTIDSLIADLQSGDKLAQYRAIEALGDTGDEHAADALLAAMQDEDYEIRYRAMQALAKMAGEHVINGLIALVSNERSEVRLRAVDALSRIGGTRADEALVSALNDKDAAVRYCAAMAPALRGNTLAEETLISALGDENYPYRQKIIDALVAFGDKKAADALIGGLKRENDDALRGYMLAAIGQIGDESTVPVLAELLPKYRENENAKKIVGLLGMFGDEGAAQILVSEWPYARAVRGLEIEMLKAFGNIGGELAIQKLTEVYEKDYEDYPEFLAECKVYALAMLIKLGDSQKTDLLYSLLESDEMFIRSEAAYMLGEMGDKNAVEALIALAQNDNEIAVRCEAIISLGKIGDHRAADMLLQICRDFTEEGDYSDRHFREEAMNALGKIANASDVEFLISTMQREDAFEASHRAMQALALNASERAKDALIARYSENRYQSGLADILAEMGDERAQDVLFASMQVDDITIREIAVAAIGKIGNDRAVGALVAALSDKEKTVRLRAIAALAVFQDSERAVEALISALQDHEKEERIAAILAFAPFPGNARVMEELISLMQDKDDEIRYHTADTLSQLRGQLAEKALLDAFDRRDLPAVAGGYRYFVDVCKTGWEPVLIEALNQNGGRDMAQRFLNSKNDKLKYAALNWAKVHNVPVISY